MHMPKDDPADRGACLSASDCGEIEKLFDQLLNTVGMVLPILELASTSEDARHKRLVELARETSARAFFDLKRLLWKWGRLRGCGTEESRLRNTTELFKEFCAELQTAVQAGMVDRKSLRAISGKLL